MVLHAWAVYKYDFKGEEPSRKELSKWKENLRNSILSCPLIKEIEDCHEQKIPEPYKVYQFIDSKSRNTEVNNNIHKKEDSLQDSQFLCGAENFNMPNFKVLTSVSDLQQTSLVTEKASHFPCNQLPHNEEIFDVDIKSCDDSDESLADLKLVKLDKPFDKLSKVNIISPNEGQMCGPQAVGNLQVQDESQMSLTSTPPNKKFTNHSERETSYLANRDFRSRSPIGNKEYAAIYDPMRWDCEKRKLHDYDDFRDTCMNFYPYQDVSSQELCKTQNKTISCELQSLPLYVSVSYVSHQVIFKLMQEKFKLCYVESDGMRGSILRCPTSAQFGPSDAFLVELPHSTSIESLSSKKAEIISTVLKNMKRGITVSYSGGDILATRYCKAVAYFNTQNGQQVKLERDETRKIFDFHEEFQPRFNSAQWSSLTSDVKINFGVKSSSVEVVTVTITHRDAQRMLQEKKSHELQVYTEPDCSLSNEFDTRLSIEQKLMDTHV
ncbi:hypothetical protein RRG08_012725 [Elysia crispata]|uniref:IRF tryptophan pentad repeat domain-containing protein n=1 Tax=Elysia crispata TaxID=231223 RepID=A0AAE0YRH5_9GAST|nr:hypothetical protein RRG08_012725 [Elysia crispata]